MQDTSSKVWDPNIDDNTGLNREVYRFLVTYYLYQDQLGWSRTKLLFTVEAAVLAAAFAYKGFLATAVLTAGIILVVLIWFIVERDWQIRDQHLAVLDRVHLPRGLMMTVPAKWLGGGCILRLIFGFLIVADVFLVFIFYQCLAQPAPACHICGLFGIP